jgi:hypothetical protein
MPYLELDDEDIRQQVESEIFLMPETIDKKREIALRQAEEYADNIAVFEDNLSSAELDALAEEAGF